MPQRTLRLRSEKKAKPGEIEIQAWHKAIWSAMEHQRRMGYDHLRYNFNARIREQAQDAALVVLKQSLFRIARGELGMRFHIWRDSLRREAWREQRHLVLASQVSQSDKEKQHRSIQARMEQMMRAQGQSTGIRLLRQILRRRTQGAVGARLEIWRTAMQDENRAWEVRKMRRHINAIADDELRGVGVRLLRQSLYRLVKQQLGFRFEVWRQRSRGEENGLGGRVRWTEPAPDPSRPRVPQYAQVLWEFQHPDDSDPIRRGDHPNIRRGHSGAEA